MKVGPFCLFLWMREDDGYAELHSSEQTLGPIDATPSAFQM